MDRRKLLQQVGVGSLAVVSGGFVRRVVADEPKKELQQKERTKAKLIDKVGIKRSATPRRAVQQTPHTIYIINSSTDKITDVKVNSGPYGPLIPPIGQTCPSGNLQQCFDNGDYLPLVGVYCPSPTINLRLYTTGADGSLYEIVYNPFELDCEFTKTVVVLTP